MKLESVYDYLYQNGLPVSWHDDNTRIRLEESTVALSNLLFRKVYKRSDFSIEVSSEDFVELSIVTRRDLDTLIDSYLEHCDLSRAKIVRSSRLRYAIDRHERQLHLL